MTDERYGKYFTDRAFDAREYRDRMLGCVRQIRELTDFVPEAAVVLGSGLGTFADSFVHEAEIPFSSVRGFPVSTVQGHEGRLIFGTVSGKKIAAMQGRVHYYEGYSMHDVVLPIRVLRLLGADTAVLTNAVGAMNPSYKPGDFVVIEDHISAFVPSPLAGENLDELGVRFPDMSEIYDRRLRESVLSIGKEKGITVHSGVFLQAAGPQYETPAEIRAFRAMGADTVGMSTAVEATAARHMGMRVCAVSCVTNMAAGMSDGGISHSEVSSSADRVSGSFSVLISSLLASI